MASETHECPRCACQWDARNGSYRDELIDWMQHCDGIEHGYRKTIEEMHHEAFMLQTRAVILEAELLLLRYDVAEALRKVADPVAEAA